jgi:hypothetical protein
MQLAGSKDGGWVYTDRHPGAKMEIPAGDSSTRADKSPVSIGNVVFKRAFGKVRVVGETVAEIPCGTNRDDAIK